jgi:hypothetical protein
VYDNRATTVGQQFYVRGNGAQVVATYSLVDTVGQNGTLAISGTGIGNMFSNPLFQSISAPMGLDSCWRGIDDGFQLAPNSPCRDAGDPTGIAATDVLGNARIVGSGVDIGPYEAAVVLAMPDADLPTTILAFPNPTAGAVMVQLPPEVLQVPEIWSMMGQRMAVRKVDLGGNRWELDMTGLAAGLYWIRAGKASGTVLRH